MAGVVYIRSLPQLLKLPVIASVSDSADESFVARHLRMKNDKKSEKTITFCVYKRA